MKIGFQLRGSTKRKIIEQGAVADLDGPQEEGDVKMEVVTSIEGNKVLGTESEKGPLVIPMQPPRSSATTVSERGRAMPDSGQLSLDEQAAKELLADINRTGPAKTGLDLVIAAAAPVMVEGKKQPLLLANVAPEILELKDDIERYKLDISMRPDEVDFKSDAYKAVPIEEFGAALLRGMGWTGPTPESEDKDKKGYEMAVRESRLGLGATPKPPEEKKKGKNNLKVEKEKEEWKRKAEEALRKQELGVGSVVWLRDPMYAGQHARVEAVRGVPGLDRIRVTMLDMRGSDGKLKTIDVKRLDAVLVKEDGENQGTSSAPDQTHEHEHSSSLSAKNRDVDSYEGNRSRKRSRDRETREFDDDKTRRFSCDDSASRKAGKHELTESRRAIHEYDDKASAESRKGRDRVSSNAWLRPGIKVRVISEKVKCSPRYGNFSCYLKKFNVSRVSKDGLASIELIGDENPSSQHGIRVDDVKEKYLENVLPHLDGTCVILAGEYRGRYGVLKEKNKQTEELSILMDPSDRGDDKGKIVRVSFDAAAAVGRPRS